MTKIKALFIKFKEPILYVIFGGLTTLINIAVFWACDKIGLSTAVSTVLAWLLSVVFAFVTNKIYVFESKIAKSGVVIKEAVQFFNCRLATGLLDLGIMLLLVDVLHFNGLLIKILSNILVIILNYIFSKLFIFKKSNG